MNKFLVVTVYHFQLIFFFTKFFVIVGLSSSLEFTLTLFAEPVEKE